MKALLECYLLMKIKKIFQWFDFSTKMYTCGQGLHRCRNQGICLLLLFPQKLPNIYFNLFDNLCLLLVLAHVFVEIVSITIVFLPRFRVALLFLLKI
jgi:hypothetical protein